MIYTCTLNPSVDYYITIDQIDKKDVTRSTHERYDVGGKGINVSRVLKLLNTDSVALSFVGGFSGSYITNYMDNHQLTSDFISIEGTTRINVKNIGEVKLDVSGSGPTISTSEYQILLEKINTLTSSDWLVISGSVPNGISEDVYKEITQMCMEKNIPFIVDTTGKQLTDSLVNQPFLIKPNHIELKELFHMEINSIEDYIYCAKQLLEKGVQNVVVSMSSDGALFVNNEHQLYIKNLKRPVVNTVGCGDSLVAGFIHEYIKTHDYVKTFRYACAVGNAKAFNDYNFDEDKVREIYNELEIIDLNNK